MSDVSIYLQICSSAHQWLDGLVPEELKSKEELVLASYSFLIEGQPRFGPNEVWWRIGLVIILPRVMVFRSDGRQLVAA